MQTNDRLARREFLFASALATGALSAVAAAPTSATEALKKLLDGNRRFVAGQDTAAENQRSPQRRAEIAAGQNPFAVIVACADSRVAPELLFDQGLGDLFVVRVAGNIVTGAGATIKGSIEYGVAELGSPLVMVLGHTHCGAIKAALKHIDDGDAPPGSIGELVRLIQPIVARVKGQPGDPLENASRANVLAGVDKLRSLEPILAPAVTQGRIQIVGATYDLRTGKVVVLTDRK